MILGLIEHDRGALATASLEMLTMARRLANELGTSLEAVLIGEIAHPLAPVVSDYGVAKVHLACHERLDDYVPAAWARSVAQLLVQVKTDAVLAAATDRGNELMAHLAAQTHLPMAANCTEIFPGNSYRITRLRAGGSLLEETLLKGEPRLITVALQTTPATPAATAGEGTLITFNPTLTEQDFRVSITERLEVVEKGVSLTAAPIVVGGGRGVGGPEGFALLEELAELLGGTVGASRVATNNGWRPHADQIGQTGSRIAPDLYIACGISGAIQHIVGCRAARQILAINSDPEAPIMAKADYAVIGDLHEILPVLIDEIKKNNSYV